MTQLYTANDHSAHGLEIFLHKTLSVNAIASLAKKTGFVNRENKFSPFLFVRSCLDSMTDKRWSCSSIYRKYVQYSIEHNPNQSPLSWGPFFDRLQKEELYDFVQALINKFDKYCGDGSLGNTANLVQILSEKLGITDITPHDGACVQIFNRELGKTFYHTGIPAVKIHGSVSLNSFIGAFRCITPGQADERVNMPRDERANRKLIICDAGYDTQGIYRDIENNGGFYLIKTKKCCGYKIHAEQLYDSSGAVGNPSFPVVKGARVSRKIKVSELPRDLKDRDMICQTQDGFLVRVIRFWILEEHKELCIHLVTNIPPEILDGMQIAALYRARWQVELLWKTYKSYCEIKGSLSSNIIIQKAMMLFAILAQVLRVSLGQTVELETRCCLSPMKVIHDAAHDVFRLLDNLLRNESPAQTIRNVISVYQHTMTKSAPSYINRLRGKSVDWIIEKISAPPLYTTTAEMWRNRAALFL